MDYLVDTNVLLRFVDRSHVLHSTIRHAVRTLYSNGDTLLVTSQNLVEFWNVATRPAAKNGFGLTVIDADRRLRVLERIFSLLPESIAIYQEWRRLVVTFSVSGVQVHDARLIANMHTNNVSHVLTFNTSDFVRYAPEGIVAVNPASV